MHSFAIAAQDSATGSSSEVLKLIEATVAMADFRHLRMAMAYARLSASTKLVSRLRSRSPAWPSIAKEWLISIDFGRTDPDSLHYLHALKRSEVRVPDGDLLLGQKLRPQRCFHPKTLILESQRGSNNAALAVVVGSANLTTSGLQGGAEHVTSAVWIPPLTGPERKTRAAVVPLFEWWDRLWETSTPVTSDFLTEYAKVRKPIADEDDALAVQGFIKSEAPVISTDPGVGWAAARFFWIQTYELYKNLGANTPGNQLDCTRGTRVFFGFSPNSVPRNTVLGSIILRFGNKTPRPCSVRFGNNQMDKLNLPLPGVDGPPSYDNTYLLFERRGPKAFGLSLASQGQEYDWREFSRRQQMRYDFSGGREYGFFS